MNAPRPGRVYGVAVAVLALVTATAWVTRDRRALPGPGRRAPAFEATTLDGRATELGDYRGTVVLLNIWATWCAPCREEMPSMERLYRRMRALDQDFTILAVSVDAAPGEPDAGGNIGGDLEAFARELDLTFPILRDAADIQRLYYTTGVPESFLIDGDGVIRSHIAGSTDWDSPERVRFVLATLAPPPELVSGQDPITIVNSAPERGSVGSSPTSVSLWFSQPPPGDSVVVRVVDFRGHVLQTDTARSPESERNRVTVPIRGTLAPGTHTVVWRAAGLDGATVREMFSFGVEAGTPDAVEPVR